MSIRSGVVWAISSAIALAGCAALVGAEEATLVQGTGGSAGQGGSAGNAAGQGGSAGGGECQAPLVSCSGKCVNLEDDQQNCGECGLSCGKTACSDGLCLPEELLGGTMQAAVVDLATTQKFLYVMFGNGSVLRVDLDTLGREEVKPAQQIFAPRLASLKDLVFAFGDTGGGNWMLERWGDDGSYRASEIMKPFGKETRLAVAGDDAVFANQSTTVIRFALDGTDKYIGQFGAEPTEMAADPNFIYAAGNTQAAYMPATGGEPIGVGTMKNPVYVALRPGGALYVDHGSEAQTGALWGVQPGAAPERLGPMLDFPVEAIADQDGVYFIEDPGQKGLIKYWQKSDDKAYLIAAGQVGASRLALSDDHVYWGMLDGRVMRVPQ